MRLQEAARAYRRHPASLCAQVFPSAQRIYYPSSR